MAFWYLWWVKRTIPANETPSRDRISPWVRRKSRTGKLENVPIMVTNRPAKLTGVNSSPNAHDAIEIVVTSLKTPATLRGTTPARWMMLQRRVKGVDRD